MSQPLAARVRPRTLDEFVGQKHLLGEGKVLRKLIEEDNISSMIFWGPPGVGKTTLARIIAGQTRSEFVDFSAVTSGIKEIRQVMKQADENGFTGRIPTTGISAAWNAFTPVWRGVAGSWKNGACSSAGLSARSRRRYATGWSWPVPRGISVKFSCRRNRFSCMRNAAGSM